MPQPIVTDPEQVFDVFQSGLVRGTARLPFAPRKEYFYVEHPVEGWRVYLRAACFLHELYKPFQAAKFLVVKGTGGDAAKATWEPPKGQMEGKDTVTAEAGRTTLLQLLKKTIRREVAEEAKVRVVRDLTHTGLVLQSIEPDFPPNTYFQYHVFSGYVHPLQLEKAFAEFAWIQGHLEQFLREKSDVREKDALTWYSAGTTKLMGRWSPTLVAMYVKHFKKGSK
jgi:8-oxo-dGTP pyrophosphatase MutT (NUDIX family)